MKISLSLQTSYQLLGLFVLTIIVSILPDFHPEEYVHRPYSVWLDGIFHGGYYFLISIGALFIRTRFRYFSLLVFLLLFLLSVLLELVQLLIPGRYFTVNDLLSNFLGILAAAIFCFLLVQLKSKK